jgi:hypothetical protein
MNQGIGDEPKPPPVGEFFREVSENVGEDLAFAPLGRRMRASQTH